VTDVQVRPVLSAQAHAARRPNLTPGGWRALRELVKNGEPMTKFAIARALGVHPSSITWLVKSLRNHGFVKEVPREAQRATYAPLVALTTKGAAAGQELHESKLLDDVSATQPKLPERVALYPKAAALLRFLHSEAAAGRIPTYLQCAASIDTARSYVGRLLKYLADAGCAIWDPQTGARVVRLRLTAIGMAAAEGRIALVELPRPMPPGPTRRRGSSASTLDRQAPTREARPPVPAPPAPRTPSVIIPPAPTRARVETRPPEVSAPLAPALPLPEVPAALKTFRGIKHPPMPQGYERHAGISRGRWEELTALKVGQDRWSRP